MSMESFEKACLDIAEAFKIPEATIKEEDPKELVRLRLSSSRAGPWLLIVDNADDADIFFGTGQKKGIHDYLAESEKGIVVYTTRTPEVAELMPGDVIELGAMSRQDARDFLAKSLTRNDLYRAIMTTAELVDELLSELTCLPLAVTQAAAHLNWNRMSISKYLSLLRNTEQGLVSVMSREFRDDTRYKGSVNAVATTWVVSFVHIRKHDTLAAALLEFVSCVEWKAIPRSLLPSFHSEAKMEDAIGTLSGYSFFVRRGYDGYMVEENLDGVTQPANEELFDIHRLVHMATRIWIQEHGDSSRVIDHAIQHVQDVFPYVQYANQQVWRAYLPHTLRLLGGGRDRDAREHPELCSKLGRCLRLDGRSREAVLWLERSCQLRSKRHENDSLGTQHQLAVAYREDGQNTKALELLEAILEAMNELAY